MNVVRGGDIDRWDIQVRLGPLGSARLRVAVEEHGQGRQLVRYRVWPRWSRAAAADRRPVLALWLAGCAVRQYLARGVDRRRARSLVLLRACQEAGAGVASSSSAIGDEVGDRLAPESTRTS